MHHQRIAGAITALALLTAAACSGGGDSAPTTTDAPIEDTTTTAAPPTTEAETPTETTVPEDIPLRQPLTGEIVESEDDLITRPALVVKIDNNDANARQNQSGLAVADIVFEEIVEGDTRFAAVFQSQDSDPVGPIRSGREQDVAMLSSMNHPLFAWSGGNPGVTRLIRSSFLTDLNATREASGAYYRGPGSRPHDLYSSTEALYALTPEDHPGAPLQQFNYVQPDEEFAGEEVVDFDLRLRFKNVRWEWDAIADGFARYQSGSRHVDAVHGEIFATNVIVLVSEYGQSSIDSRSPEAKTLGSGPVYVFSNGQVIVGRWEREFAVGGLRLVDTDGEIIGLTPGNTWIEVADLTGDGSFVVGPGERPSADTAESSLPGAEGPPQIDITDPDAAPTDITIRFPEVSEADAN